MYIPIVPVANLRFILEVGDDRKKILVHQGKLYTLIAPTLFVNLTLYSHLTSSKFNSTFMEFTFHRTIRIRIRHHRER